MHLSIINDSIRHCFIYSIAHCILYVPFIVHHFLAENSGEQHEQEHHLHESPPAMTIPLIILAILSVIGGFVGIPEVLMQGGDKITEFLSPVIPIKTGETSFSFH